MTIAGRPRRRRSEAGAGLLELIVATTVALFALSLGANLLLESQRRLLRAAGSGDHDAILALATARLRADVAASRDIVGPRRDLWDRGPLELLHDDGRRLRWRLASGSLWRDVFAADGSLESSGTLVRGAELWRWHEPAAGRELVVLELAIRREVARGRVRGAAQSVVTAPRRTARRLVVALRAGGGAAW